MSKHISYYFDMSRLKSLSVSHLMEWCSGKAKNALVVEMGDRDSYPLRLELLRLAVGHRSKKKELLPYVLNTSSLPPGGDASLCAEKALPLALQIDTKELRDQVFTFFQIWSLKKEYIEAQMNLLTQDFKYLRAFNLLSSFDYLYEPGMNATFKVILPLIAKNNLESVVAEAKRNPKFRDMLLRDLDSTYNQAVLSSYPLLDKEFTRKKIHKTIRSLLKSLEYNEEDFAVIAPNFFLEKLLTAMRYHVITKYELRLNDWRDILSWNLDKYPSLEPGTKRYIAKKMLYDEEEIYYWNRVRGWNLSAIPMDQEGSDESLTRKNFYKCGVPRSQIILITSINFDFFLNMLSSTFIMATGYDSEFLNDFGSYQNKVVLIQIAIGQQVFILDMLDILKYDQLLIKLKDKYFNNPMIKILGYGIHSDFQALANTHPIFSDMSSSSIVKANVMDLNKVAFYVSNVLGINYKEYPSSEKGLSGFIESLFGQPLDKSFQRSFWARRPLEEDQLIYGALDAHVLLNAEARLYALSFQFKAHQKYNFFFEMGEQYIPESVSRKTRRSKNKNIKNKIDSESISSSFNSPKIEKDSSPKFICNSMLHGLTKKLRAFGIDTHFLETSNPDLLADAALNTNRIILSRGKMVDRLNQHRPDVRVFRVINDKANDQAQEVILEFKIVVSEEDIFKRCVLCNCNEYIILSKEEMAFLRNTLKFSKKGHLKKGAYQIAYPSIQLNSGVILRITDVPEEVAQSVQAFYVCSSCGHVYWKGSHWDQMKLKRSALQKS